jgi:hypothetical protein
MISQVIKLWKEPEPVVHVNTYHSYNSYKPKTFTTDEVNKAIETAELCGLTKDLVLRHTPTGHTVRITGYKRENVGIYQGNPMVICGIRTRDTTEWHTTFTVEELLAAEYIITDPPIIENPLC